MCHIILKIFQPLKTVKNFLSLLAIQKQVASCIWPAGNSLLIFVLEPIMEDSPVPHQNSEY